ncbi:MAG: hypothetical protein ABI476_04305 [Oxalobacteraceae bacterium]
MRGPITFGPGQYRRFDVDFTASGAVIDVLASGLSSNSLLRIPESIQQK